MLQGTPADLLTSDRIRISRSNHQAVCKRSSRGPPLWWLLHAGCADLARRRAKLGAGSPRGDPRCRPHRRHNGCHGGRVVVERCHSDEGDARPVVESITCAGGQLKWWRLPGYRQGETAAQCFLICPAPSPPTQAKPHRGVMLRVPLAWLTATRCLVRPSDSPRDAKNLAHL